MKEKLILFLKTYPQEMKRILKGEVFVRASTTTRTIISWILYSLSVVSMIPSLIDVIIDVALGMFLHVPGVILSASFYQLAERVHQ